MTEGGSATVSALLSHAVDREVSLQLGFAGSASASDYAYASNTITIPSGQTGGQTQITTTDDAFDEHDETVIVSITGASGADASSAQPATLVIQDNDPLPTVRLSTTTEKLHEGTGTATLTAVLNRASGREVTVQLAFSGSATHPDDYSRTGDAIRIAAGATQGTVTVTTVEDSHEEPKESIIVDVASVNNGQEWENQRVTMEIHDDDDRDDDGATPTTTSSRPTTTSSQPTTTSRQPTTSSPSTRSTQPPTPSPTSSGSSPTSSSPSSTSGAPSPTNTGSDTTSPSPTDTSASRTRRPGGGGGGGGYQPPITTTLTTTDEAGQTYEVVRTFVPEDPEYAGSLANHTTGFEQERHRPLEGQGTPSLAAPMTVLVLAAIVAILAARRR